MLRNVSLSIFICLCAGLCLAQKGSLRFGGSNAYVELDTDPALDLQAFTLECWVRKESFGISVSTGSGGVRAIPLLAKGIGGEEGKGTDVNFFLGIMLRTDVLCLDFEESPQGSSPGANHPLIGKTALKRNTWYHVAATYDGKIAHLYVDGKLEASKLVDEPVYNNAKQRLTIGAATDEEGDPAGFFEGSMDEVRVWNYARTQEEIVANANLQIGEPKNGLVGCWPMDSTLFWNVVNTASSTLGMVVSWDYTWLDEGAPFNIITQQNIAPTLIDPITPLACPTGDSVTISVSVDQKNADKTLIAKFYGRLKHDALPIGLVALPDVQFYTSQTRGGSNKMFKAQTEWVVENKDLLNIAHVMQLGDCVQNGDNNGDDIEWKRADTTMRILEDSATTRIHQGMSYTMCVGNHDQSPIYDPNGTTTFFNKYFGVERFSGRYYWGGNYKTNADNSYQLFSKQGLDFIVVSVEYDEQANTDVLAWADSLLKVHKNKYAIIVSHFLINDVAAFGAQGQAIYDALKNNPNLFLMFSGHQAGEAVRRNEYEGRVVYSLLSNFQRRINGGDGWMRTMKIDPSTKSMEVETYSPWLDEYENDDNSHFTLRNLNIESPNNPYVLLHQDTVRNGEVDFLWEDLKSDTSYEWFATISDGTDSVSGRVHNVQTYLSGGSPTFTTSDTLICEGDVAVFETRGSRLYRIQVNGKGVTTASKHTSYRIPDLKNGDQVVMQAMNDCQSYRSEPFEMSVIENPLNSIRVSRSDSMGYLCAGDSVRVVVSNAQKLQYFLNENMVSVDSQVVVYPVKATDTLTINVQNECFDSYKDLSFNVKELPVAIINQIDNVLFSNYLDGNQWFFNGEILSNETQQYILPKDTGNYAVRVSSEFGCVGDVSPPFKVTSSGTGSEIAEVAFLVYPNPFAHALHIQAVGAVGQASIQLFDAHGTLVAQLTRNFSRPENRQLVVLDSYDYHLEAGIYFLRILSEKGLYSTRVISLGE